MTGIWVVRPWDVPDEIGHFSYIRDLATGKGLPVLHETAFDETVWRSFAPDPGPPPDVNWIAQHPPLYHLIMVPVYWLGSLFGESFWGSFYLIRIATAVLFGLGIGVLMKAFRATDIPEGPALGFGIMVAAIPNHTYLASGVNHDALVFLLGSLVLLFWVRYTKSGARKDLFGLGLCMGLGGVAKYTFLVLFPPLLVLVGLVFLGKRDFAWKPVVQFLLLVLVPVCLWMVRNLFLLGEILPVDATGFQSDHPLGYSFLDFGKVFPELSILLQTFWGLIGWMGDGNLQVRWLQTYSIYQEAYTWPLIPLMALTLYYLFKDGSGDWRRMLFGAEHTAVVLLLFHFFGGVTSEYSHFLLFFYLGVAVAGWSSMEYLYCLFEGLLDTERIIEIGCLAVFFFFLGVHLYKIYSFTISSGSLQGTFGRYYLPVIGFAVIGFWGRGVQRFRFAPQLVLTVAIVYTCTELYIWAHEVMPFFHVFD